MSKKAKLDGGSILGKFRGDKYRVYKIHEVVGAFVRPKDMTKYSYSPYRVEKAVLEISPGWIFI